MTEVCQYITYFHRYRQSDSVLYSGLEIAHTVVFLIFNFFKFKIQINDPCVLLWSSYTPRVVWIGFETELWYEFHFIVLYHNGSTCLCWPMLQIKILLQNAR